MMAARIGSVTSHARVVPLPQSGRELRGNAGVIGRVMTIGMPPRAAEVPRRAERATPTH